MTTNKEDLEKLRARTEEVRAARERFARLIDERHKLQETLNSFRGELPSVEKDQLGYINQMVLAAVYSLRGKGDARDVAAKVKELSLHPLEAAAILIALDRLQRWGLISSRRGEEPIAEPELDHQFAVTPEGERLLADVRAAAKRLVDALEGIG